MQKLINTSIKIKSVVFILDKQIMQKKMGVAIIIGITSDFTITQKTKIISCVSVKNIKI